MARHAKQANDANAYEETAKSSNRSSIALESAPSPEERMGCIVFIFQGTIACIL
jgi:hypothetical protein